MPFRSKKSEEFELAQRLRLLTEWYGRDIAATEMAAHSRQPLPVGDFLDEITEKIFSREVRLRIKLEENWEAIAGRQLAALTKVAAFQNGELFVEVRHSAFLRELGGTEDLLLARVNEFLGGGVCRTIRFTAAGGNLYAPRAARRPGGAKK